MIPLEYHARVHVRSKIHYFRLIKERLGLDRCLLFRSTCFGRWLDLTYVDNEEGLIHYMLQKQMFSDNDHYDLPLIYKVNGHMLHFGRREFCLITGFKFGMPSLRKFREGDISFRDRVFPEKLGEYVKNIDLLFVIEDEERFTKLSDEDSIRVCLLLALEVIFMGHELGSAVDDVWLRMVDNLEAWNDFSWGEHLWRELYDAIRNVNSKHKDEHHTALEKNPNFVPSYSLSGFLLCFKIWILESSSVTDRWWSKDPEVIPRGCSWSKHLPFQEWEIFSQLFPQGKNPNYDLYPNRDEGQSEWYIKSQNFFSWYTPRAPPVEYGGLFGEYLKKVKAAKASREKDMDAHPVRQSCKEDAHPVRQSCSKEDFLQKRVMALERLCESLFVLPKEMNSLKGRVYKLETIVNYIARKKKDGPLDHKVNTAGEKVNMHIVGKERDLGDEYASDLDEAFFQFFDETARESKKHVSEYMDGLENLTQKVVDAIGEVVADKSCEADLSEDESVKAQKQEAELRRLGEQRRQRSRLLLEERNSMQGIELMNAPHMKLSLQRCGTTKRRYVNVLRPPMELDKDFKVPSMDALREQKNLLDEFMIERCQDLKPWKEEPKRRGHRIDRIFTTYELEEFLIKSVCSRCKFPWCNDISVERAFWDSLLGLDDKRVGWLLDEHIDLWVWYMWHFRQSSADWSMVSCYFLTLLLQDSMPLFYATDEIYPFAWKDVEQVFIPINEPKRHWSLAQFHIQSGIVTFYDSEETYEDECRPWYLRMRSCLEDKLPVVLHEAGVFATKGIDPLKYSITFRNAQNVPKQGGVFGDCGVFVCLFLYRLAHGMPLVVEDPIQKALAYREQMVQFYFKHKILCP